MYAIVIRHSLTRRELFSLPLFASPLDARMFLRGFRFGLEEAHEVAEEDAPAMFKRGARFAFQWQNYAHYWGADPCPIAVIEGVSPQPTP